MARSFQHGPRTLGVALAMAVLLASCGGGASGTPSSTPTGAPSGATSTPRPLDQALVSELVAKGIPRADAIFMALASITVTPGDGKSERIVETFPTGNKVDMTVALDPTRHAQPDTLVVSSSETDAALTFTLSYFVPFAGMPDDVRQWIGSLTPSGPALLAFTGSGKRGPSPLFADADGTGVIVQGIYSKATKEAVVLALETLKETYGYETSPLALEVAEPVVESALLTKEWIDLAGQFDELQKCAENPTDPLTKKLYQEQPGEKDKLLQTIKDARTEMAINTIVGYIAALNNFISDFVPKAVGWLIGPATKLAMETLNNLNKQRLEELANQIPKCVQGYAFAGTWPAPYGDHPPQSVGAVSCTADLSGKWAVFSYGIDVGLDVDTLIDKMNDPANHLFVGLYPDPFGLVFILPGEEVAYEGVLTPSKRPPPTVTLDITFEGNNVYSHVYELSPVKGSTMPNVCATG